MKIHPSSLIPHPLFLFCGALFCAFSAALAAEELPTRGGVAISTQTGQELLRIVGQAENRDRLRALLQLGQVELPADDAARKQALDLVAKAAKDPDPIVRACAAWVVGGSMGRAGQKPDAAALGILVPLIADPAALVRRCAIQIAEILRFNFPNDVAALDSALTRALSDAEETVRIAAARALRDRTIRIRRSVYVDAPALSSRPVDTPADNSEIKARLRERFSAESALTVRAELLGSLASYGFSAAAPVIPSALTAEELPLRLAALDALHRAKVEEGTSYAAILQKMSAPDQPWVVRERVWASLGVIAPEWTRVHVADALRDGNLFIRAAGARALGVCGEAASADRLVALFGDAEGYVRRNAADAVLNLHKRGAITKDAVEKIAVAAASSSAAGQFREGLWMLGQTGSQAGFPGILRFVKNDPKPAAKSTPDDLAALDAAALTLWVIAKSKYAAGAEDAVRVFASASADEACRLQALNAIGALAYAPAGKVIAAKLEESKKMEMETVWVLDGRLRREAFQTLLALATPETGEAILNSILCPQPLELEENFEPGCRWLVKHLSGEAAKSAATDIAAAKKGKTFSDFAKAALAWTEAGLNGTDAGSFPVSATSSTAEAFLSATK